MASPRAPKRCVAWMKEMRRLDNGEPILAAKAPYDLDYVAAAIALLGGWFAKGNGAPNLTVAASKLRSPGAGALTTTRQLRRSRRGWSVCNSSIPRGRRRRASTTASAKRRSRRKRSRC